VWNPAAGEVGPYIQIDGWSTSLIGSNRESCANEYLGYIIGGLGTGGTGAGQLPTLEASAVGRQSSQAAEFRKNFRFEDYPAPGLDPLVRLQEMDKDGVEAEVLYASHLRHFYELGATDEPFFHDIAESYNEWIMEFAGAAPKRLIALPVISVLNPECAAQDIRSYAKRGAKGFMIGSSVPIGMTYGDATFDPIWAAAVECGVPLCMHTTTGRFKTPTYHHPRARSVIGTQGEVQTSLAELIYGGVFDRFPDLKIVCAEFDIGWVGYSVQRMDTNNPSLGLKLSPSEYMRRNVFFTFQNDRVGCLQTPFYGADNFMWASDYPHGVTTWPDSQAIVDLQFEGLPAETKRKVARENVIRVFNLEL
jgi:predicted TIM-barrel fold metal-dependent hydrolase